MNNVRSSSLSKKSYASWRTLMNWCTGSIPLSGISSSASSASGNGAGGLKRCVRNAGFQ